MNPREKKIHREPLQKKTKVQEGYRAALQYAYKLLSYRGRSEKEMRERLNMKGFERQDIDNIISQLKINGFLDDRKLADSLKIYAAEVKHLGIAGTKKFLGDRGIPSEIISIAAKDIDETAAAESFVAKKLRTLAKATFRREPFPLTDKTVKRLYGILSRRGFSSDIIKKTMAQFKYPEAEK